MDSRLEIQPCILTKFNCPLQWSLCLTPTVPRTAPDVPSINHVGIVDETSIFVNWTALDDVDSYTLEIRTSHREKEGEREGEGEGDEDDDEQDVSKNGDSNEGESVKTLDLDTNKHIITDVDFELIYSFRVKATNDIGSSDYSSAYEFDPETALERGHGRERSGLRGWEVALIVIFIILLLLLCCILLLCICLCWRREKRTYYAAKKGKRELIILHGWASLTWDSSYEFIPYNMCGLKVVAVIELGG